MEVKPEDLSDLTFHESFHISQLEILHVMK